MNIGCFAALLPRALLLVFVSTITMTLLVICLWWLLDEASVGHVQSLDRDGDGSWSQAEQAGWSERERACFDKAFADGARNLIAICVYPLFALIYSTIVAGLWLLLAARRRGRSDGARK